MKQIKFAVWCWLLTTSTFLSCAREVSPPSPEAGIRSINAENLARHIETLASDEFEGRLPGSKGEELTINYLADQFKELGLQPGKTDESYFQTVPLVGINADPGMTLVLSGGSQEIELEYGDEFMAGTKRVVEGAGIKDSDVIFLGYGVVAPEFEWDDFKGADVKDKTLIVLVNDPPVPTPTDPSQLDENMFGGKAMTYYGRWTYKYEIAAEKGAEGCFIVHETGPAGYPWEVVKGGWSGEQFDLVAPDKNLSRCAVEGWLTYEKTKELFQLAGQDLEALKEAAARRDFKPVPLGLKASLSVKNTLRPISSNNVVAKLEGGDPNLRDQYVVYMAHWDHLGKDPTLKDDQIYNGARDNASGTAGLLEIAEAFTKLERSPRRSLLFLASTAEEQGLLGSRYYAEKSLYPLTRTVAVINMDILNVLGKTKDVIIIGMGNSTLDDAVEAAAREQGRTVRPDPEPEKGFYYRSDHFSFAKQGVPALYVHRGVDYVGKPEGWGLQMREEYTSEYYHKPSDEFDSNWDLSGMVEDLQLLLQVGYLVANEEKYPEWSPGTEFKARREQMIKESRVGQ